MNALIRNGIAVLAVGLVCLPAAAEEAVEYTASDTRDPFGSLLPAPPQPQQPAVDTGNAPAPGPVNVDFLNVSGVIWNAAKSQAIINGAVVNVGSDIDGAVVTAIDHAQVSVRYQGREFVLTTQAKKGGRP